MADAALGIAQTGSSEVGSVTQTWTIDGTPTTVYIQGFTLVDSINNIKAQVDANGLHVVPSIGAPNASGPIEATNIAYGTPATLVSTVPITDGKTGTLQHAIFASTQPTQWTIQTVNNASSATSRVSFITNANETYDYRAVMNNELSTVLASTANVIFQVVATNLNPNTSVTATAFANFFWSEN